MNCGNGEHPDAARDHPKVMFCLRILWGVITESNHLHLWLLKIKRL